MSGYVDAHHHIWRVQDLPWLSGPMIPRIFGPYESLQQRDYLAAEYGAEAAAHGFTQSVYVQANWPLERSLDEVRWVQAQHDETGWPSAIVGSADLFDPQVGAVLEAQAKASPLMRGTRLQLHWHEHEAFRFASGPDRMLDPTFNENLGLVEELGWVFELQVFPNQLEGAERLLEAHPGLTFVLIHAGMPIEGEPWREALAALAQYPNLTVKLSGQGTFIRRVDPDWIRTVTRAVVDTFGAERAMFGSNFPVESIWTDFSGLVKAWFAVLADFPQEVQDDIMRPDCAPRIQARHDQRKGGMAYTIAVTWIAKPGEEDEVARCLSELVEPSRAEEGTLVYIPNRDPEDPARFFIYEMYVDEAAYKAHTETEHFQRLGFGDAIPRLLERKREFYESMLD